MENTTGIELAEILGNFVNTSNRDKSKEFIEGFSRQHRTLQQSSFRLIMELIEFMASDNYKTDLRNESSKAVAKRLINGFETEYHKELKSQGVSERNIESSTGEHFLPSKFLQFI